MKTANWLCSLSTSVVVLLMAACYTLPGAAPRKKTHLDRTALAATELQSVIYDFVQESLYTYPHLATRAGMHSYTLPKGDKVDLDRELPNYSNDLVDARIGSLEATLKRLDDKVPAAALSLNNLADRRLLVAAIRRELFDWKQLETHHRDPLLHARALAEALYYPLVFGYAPEEKRLADVLGRLHWVPAYTERAARMINGSSEPAAAAAAEVNRFTIGLVRTELDKRIPKDDGELRKTYDGMKAPVLEALEGFQRFLEKDLGGGRKIPWRMGQERYEERFALSYHDAISPQAALEAARKAVVVIERAMYDVALPAYCQANEKDRENCGPTKAEIAAVAKAEQDRLRKEEERKKKQAAEEEQKRREEERQAAKEERERKEEERKKAAEEEKMRKEEERNKAAKEKDRKKKDISNPYEDAPKKEEKKPAPDKVTNPYGFYRTPPGFDCIGAKLAGQAEASEKTAPDTKKEPTAEMVARVVSFVFDTLRKPQGGASGGAVEVLEQTVRAAAASAASRGVLDATALDDLAVEPSPVLLAALHQPLVLLQQPVFQPVQGARLFVEDGEKAGLVFTRTFAVAAALGSPGRFEALRRAVKIEPETRRALRVLHGDPAWLAGWGLHAAEQLALAEAAADDSAGWRGVLEVLAEIIRSAVALSIDVRVHTGNLSEKDAISELVSKTGVDRATAEQMLRRIAIAPTEAAAAFLGYQTWNKAARLAEDMTAFHVKALGLGPVPLNDLQTLLDAADPDAVPDLEQGIFAEPEPQGKRRVSVLDAL